MKKITVLGGGTGTFVVLSGLKKYPIDLAVIVSMMDSGGSTGRLQDQLGVLPPGDLRQSLVALSEAARLWRKLFLYRFESGDLEGHNFGNIFLSALEKVTPNYDKVIETASYVLKVKGQVIPVTFKKSQICVRYQNGKIIKGEGNIDENYEEKTRVIEAFLEPQVEVNKKAINRLLQSDYIVVGPGDLYASIVPILLVDGVKKAIDKSNAKIIYNMNLMTKSGQTTNYKASDHVSDIKKYMGGNLEVVVVNNGKIPKRMLKWYQEEGEHEVKNNLDKADFKSGVVTADIVDRRKFEKPKQDKFVTARVRSVLRHNPDRLAKVLMEIIQ